MEVHIDLLICVYFADVDECATENNDCAQQAKCINTEGTYKCICLPGYLGDGKSCSGNITKYLFFIIYPIVPAI